jgi:hypothetical protein
MGRIVPSEFAEILPEMVNIANVLCLIHYKQPRGITV